MYRSRHRKGKKVRVFFGGRGEKYREEVEEKKEKAREGERERERERDISCKACNNPYQKKRNSI